MVAVLKLFFEKISVNHLIMKLTFTMSKFENSAVIMSCITSISTFFEFIFYDHQK